uniref:Uncharacterized protein n=1 Tax=Oryza rufipogon TaxID=4529 RepID=A0A0E0R6H3_ORYRU
MANGAIDHGIQSRVLQVWRTVPRHRPMKWPALQVTWALRQGRRAATATAVLGACCVVGLWVITIDNIVANEAAGSTVEQVVATDSNADAVGSGIWRRP